MQRTKQSRGCSRQQESVPKSTRNAGCIGGRDFRDQNDAKKRQKTRLPEVSKEGLNASLIEGKACAAATTQS